MFKIWKKEKRILLNLLYSEINYSLASMPPKDESDKEYIRESKKYHRTLTELYNRLSKIETVD